MSRFSRWEDLPTELFSNIAASLLLHAAPSALPSLVLVNHAFFEVHHPILYSQVILKNDKDTHQMMSKLFQQPELRRYVRGLHIVADPSSPACDIISGLVHLVSSDCLPGLISLTVHPVQQMAAERHRSRLYRNLPVDFWSNLLKKCPLIKSVVVSGLEDTRTLQSSGLYEFKDFRQLERVRISFYSRNQLDFTIEESELASLVDNVQYLSPSLSTLSLDFGFYGEDELITTENLFLQDFPCLTNLTLSSFQVSNSSDAMLFWTRHPNLERLKLSSASHGGIKWFTNDIHPGILPNLMYLEVSTIGDVHFQSPAEINHLDKADIEDVVNLVPILHQLISLSIRKSTMSDIHDLLGLLQGGLPLLRSLDLIQSAISNESFSRLKLIKDYTVIEHIAKGFPNLEELGLKLIYISVDTLCDILCNKHRPISVLDRLERIYVSFVSEAAEYSVSPNMGLFQGASRLAKEQNFGKFQSMTHISDPRELPYTVARALRNGDGSYRGLKVGKAFGMEIGYERYPFPGIPGAS